jgi:hypothetical protein
MSALLDAIRLSAIGFGKKEPFGSYAGQPGTGHGVEYKKHLSGNAT